MTKSLIERNNFGSRMKKRSERWWGNKTGKSERCLKAMIAIQQDMMRVILKALQKELPRMCRVMKSPIDKRVESSHEEYF